MNRRELRRSCGALVGALNLSVPAEPDRLMDRVCELMGQRLGRPVRRRFVPFPPGTLSGLWVATDTEHFILVEQGTSKWHQLVIFCHEIGHMATDHRRVPVQREDASRVAFSSLDPSTVDRIVAGRTHCSSPAEREAELFGSMLLARVSRWLPRETWVVPAAAAGVVHRLETSLCPDTDRGRRA